MIVMKFGGTSVQDAEAIDRIPAIVSDRLAERPVVVVSALAKITDQLLAMAAAAGAGDRAKALETYAGRCASAITARPAESARREGFCSRWAFIRSATSTAWKIFCAALWQSASSPPRTTDTVSGFGERVSSKIVAAAFAQRGIDATHVDSRQCIVTDANMRQSSAAVRRNQRTAGRDRKTADRSRTRAVMGGFIAATAKESPPRLDEVAPIFQRRHGRCRTGRRADRDLDGRGRHDDHRSDTCVRKRGASRPSALKRRPSWRISAQKCCTPPPCCLPSRKIFPC